MRILMIAASLAAACLATPVGAQRVNTLPGATTLTGVERIVASQGAGCATNATPCTAVTVQPSQIATYLAPTFQAADADLAAIAALATVDFGRQLLTRADATAVRTVLAAAAAGANTDITSLAGLTTALSLAQGGTGANSAANARTSLGLGTIATQASSAVAITGGSLTNIGTFTSATALTPTSDNLRTIGTSAARWSAAYAVQLRPGTGAPIWTSGAGTPLGVVTAPIGSLYTRTDGGAVTTLYVKESGTDATGWVAK